MTTESVKIRRSVTGLGHVIAFRVIEKIGWPRTIDPKFYPVVYGDCALRCASWAHDYFHSSNFSTGLSQFEPTASVSRLARIDPLWYGRFAEGVDTRLPDVTPADLVWRHILDDPESSHPNKKQDEGKTKDRPIISEAVKRFCGLRKTEIVYVGGLKIEIDKTDEAKIVARVVAGKKRVEKQERDRLAFWAKIGFKGPLFASVNRAYDAMLEELDELVAPEHFHPDGIPFEELLARHKLRFWDWLSESDPDKSGRVRQGLSHLSHDDIKDLVRRAVIQSRIDAIFALSEAFDLTEVWQEILDFEVDAGRVHTVYALVRAGAKVTEVVKKTAQYRDDPVMLAVLKLPSATDEFLASRQNDDEQP